MSGERVRGAEDAGLGATAAAQQPSRIASFVLREDASVELANALGQWLLTQAAVAPRLRRAFSALLVGQPNVPGITLRSVEMVGEEGKRYLVELSSIIKEPAGPRARPSARYLEDWGLSQREGDVLRALADGLSNKEIALGL